MSKDEKARETPPWTMFFEGPLYRKYDDFMRHHDFSKVCDSRKYHHCFKKFIFLFSFATFAAGLFPRPSSILQLIFTVWSVLSARIFFGNYQLSLVMRKPAFSYAKTKTQISFAVTAKLISAFVFASRIVEFLYYLNPKCHASCYRLWPYSPVCVGSGRNPEDRFSHNENQLIVDLYFVYN